MAIGFSCEFAYKLVGCCNGFGAINNIKGKVCLCGSAEERFNGGVDLERGCYLAFAHQGVCVFFGLDVVALNDGNVATLG